MSVIRREKTTKKKWLENFAMGVVVILQNEKDQGPKVIYLTGRMDRTPKPVDTQEFNVLSL